MALSLIVFRFPGAASYKIVIKIRLRKKVVCKDTFLFVTYIYAFILLKDISLLLSNLKCQFKKCITWPRSIRETRLKIINICCMILDYL